MTLRCGSDDCYWMQTRWRHQMETFSALLAICGPVNSPHKGQWRGALMFSLICVWINGWVNNREAGDLRCYRAHYAVIIMNTEWCFLWKKQHVDGLKSHDDVIKWKHFQRYWTFVRGIHLWVPLRNRPATRRFGVSFGLNKWLGSK